MAADHSACWPSAGRRPDAFNVDVLPFAVHARRDPRVGGPAGPPCRRPRPQARRPVPARLPRRRQRRCHRQRHAGAARSSRGIPVRNDSTAVPRTRSSAGTCRCGAGRARAATGSSWSMASVPAARIPAFDACTAARTGPGHDLAQHVADPRSAPPGGGRGRHRPRHHRDATARVEPATDGEDGGHGPACRWHGS